ncbi:MAG: hypothetical protein ACLPOA_24275 [Methylocella sp.]|jgi:hypothetical protein
MKDPKKMRNWNHAIDIGARIVILNLIIFCGFLIFLIFSKITEPRYLTEQEAQALYEASHVH